MLRHNCDGIPGQVPLGILVDGWLTIHLNPKEKCCAEYHCSQWFRPSITTKVVAEGSCQVQNLVLRGRHRSHGQVRSAVINNKILLIVIDCHSRRSRPRPDYIHGVVAKGLAMSAIAHSPLKKCSMEYIDVGI